MSTRKDNLQTRFPFNGWERLIRARRWQPASRGRAARSTGCGQPKRSLKAGPSYRPLPLHVGSAGRVRQRGQGPTHVFGPRTTESHALDTILREDQRRTGTRRQRLSALSWERQAVTRP